MLSPAEKTTLLDMLCNCQPKDFGLSACLWSNEPIRDLVRQVFKVSISTKVVTLYLRQWGFFALAPHPDSGTLTQYTDELSVASFWRLEEYPKIRCLARRQKARIFLFAENVMCERNAQLLFAVDGRGMLRFALSGFAVTVEKRTDFLEGLLAEIGRPILLLLDSHPNHKNAAIRRWQCLNDNRITLCYIPSLNLYRLPAECWPWRPRSNRQHK